MTLPTWCDQTSNWAGALTTQKKPSAATAQIWQALGTEFQESVTSLLVKLAFKLVVIERQAQAQERLDAEVEEVETEEEVDGSHVKLSN